MRTALVSLTLTTVISASAYAQNTLRVPGQFATIQAAIVAAQGNDTVLVAPGVYGPIDYSGVLDSEPVAVGQCGDECAEDVVITFIGSAWRGAPLDASDQPRVSSFSTRS